MQVKIKESTTNSMLIEFVDEGHTLGNLLRSMLSEHPSVVSAAYRVIHPLKNLMEISFQTQKERPLKVLKTIIQKVEDLTTSTKKDFLKVVSKFKK
ncbi:MAG: RpoL/Rpb11 RNA polymerase subunit family protein [Candidatus Ranarchaeia archaeon]|jgi:DNA-directed RNA polymerase subunit L